MNCFIFCLDDCRVYYPFATPNTQNELSQRNAFFIYSGASHRLAPERSYSFSFYYSFLLPILLSLFPSHCGFLFLVGQFCISRYHFVYIDLWSILNHPCVCRAQRPVSLERGILAVEGNQRTALTSASGRWEFILLLYASIGWSADLSLAQG